MNFLPFLKLQSIFGNPSPDPMGDNVSRGLNGSFAPAVSSIDNNQQVSTPPPVVPNTNGVPSEDEFLKSLLTPNTEAHAKLLDLMNSQPKREDYKVSGLQNILGRLAGLTATSPAGISGGQPIGFQADGAMMRKIIDSNLNGPYNDAMETWKARLAPLKELADSENDTNRVNRSTAGNIIRARTAEDKIAAEKAAAEERAKAAADALDFRYWRAANVNRKLQTDSEGYVYSVNPETQKPEYLTDSNNQRIKSDKLPESEKEEIKQNNAMARISSRYKLAGQNQAATQEAITARTNTVEAGKNKRQAERANAPAKPTSDSSKPRYKIGDIKKFPNGKLGKFDGFSFVEVKPDEPVSK